MITYYWRQWWPKGYRSELVTRRYKTVLWGSADESRAVGSVVSSVYFPSMDTLALMGLQVTPEVRARGPGVLLRTRLRFPSPCNIRGSSPRTTAENASAA